MPPMKPKKGDKKDEPKQQPDPATVEAVPRVVEYPEVEATVFEGANALTVDQAKHLLGWMEEPEGEDWGSDYLLTDENGKKIRTTKNTRNRGYKDGVAKTYVQEHLQRRWRLNGETIIVGKCEEVISGQHRLVALILAEQQRLKDAETHGHWTENWPGPVTMECVVVTGIEETDDVINSVDTGCPRNLGDVLYRSHHLATYPPSKRRAMAAACDYAIRWHWHRTGAGMDAWAPRRTHAEAIDYLERHPKLLKCLKHVVDENTKTKDGKIIEDNRIKRLFPLGYSAAFMHMMGSGKSSYEKYRASDRPGDDDLSWSLYKRAEQFWSLLAGGDEFKEVRYAIAALSDPNTGKRATHHEIATVIVKAWRLFADPEFKGFTERDERINLGEDSYRVKDDRRILIENPTCGGIDLGEPKDEGTPTGGGKAADDTVEPEETEELVEEVEAEKQAVLDEAVAAEDGKGVNELITAARREWPGRLIAWRHKDHYRVWGKDADAVSKITGAKKDPKLKVDGVQYLRFAEADFPTIMATVIKAKVKDAQHVIVVRVGASGKPEMLDDDYDPDAKPAKKGKVKT